MARSLDTGASGDGGRAVVLLAGLTAAAAGPGKGTTMKRIPVYIGSRLTVVQIAPNGAVDEFTVRVTRKLNRGRVEGYRADVGTVVRFHLSQVTSR